MGIQGLLPFLKSIQKPCNLKKFAGQTIGVDAYGWLHRGTVSCAIDLALGKPTTRYVEFAMSRVRMLVHFGIKPYLVFDGDYLPGKASTETDRATRRAESRKLGLELLSVGKTSDAQSELQKAVDVTPEMARMLIEELKHSNIDFVVAPYEADSQLAYLERKGIIHGILSEDSDLLVFGARVLLTKLDQYGDCVMIRRDDFTACREVSLVGWTDADFRRMAILSGCDYLTNITNMGLKTAYRLIRKHKTVERVVRACQFEGKFKVRPNYLADFSQAEMTFLYQWVYCPLAKSLVNYNNVPDGMDASDHPYIGHYVENDVAIGVARGDLHPNTKKPMIIPSSARKSYKAIPPPRKQSVTDTPDLKKGQSIESFFKPKRTPLAELDPNSFAISPHQHNLLDAAARSSWVARVAPAYAQDPSVRHSLPGEIPQASRRSVSDTHPRAHTAHPSKRQRLCSDSATIGGAMGTHRVLEGTSRFFANSNNNFDADLSPSIGRISRKDKKKDEFSLWSDDSVEEAMMSLAEAEPTPIAPPSKKPRKSKKSNINVYVEPDAIQEMQALEALSPKAETSQESVATASTLQDSRSSNSSATTPGTSLGNLTPPSQPFVADDKPNFDKFLSVGISELRERYSYQISAADISMQTPHVQFSQRAKLSRTSSAPGKLNGKSKRKAMRDSGIAMETPEVQEYPIEAITAAEDLVDAYCGSVNRRVLPGLKDLVQQRQSEAAHAEVTNPDDDHILEWPVLQGTVVVPGSDDIECEDEPELHAKGLATSNKKAIGGMTKDRAHHATIMPHGSEDLLLFPDSADECDESSTEDDSAVKKLDLARFAYAA
ncbi:hypothetical protein K402DRAFT_254198 [Aulographum hederae CBS 113979]|uniref:Uncharacterized protein n=1 Tax=Aulographum hederae CBS 113979 TaxID=1176131 RepID=A0A6G1GJ15_9PEZI|nr:hypothetical protein K402DRAFT_254198 [Aulographum hederae CBS 113979]